MQKWNAQNKNRMEINHREVDGKVLNESWKLRDK